jgi:hypothetical protein
MSKGSNLIMKKRFPTTDRASENVAIEEAKKFMLELYPVFRVKYPDARQAPPAKGAEPKPVTPNQPVESPKPVSEAPTLS